MTHARTDACTHTHGANYNLPPASRAGDNKAWFVSEGNICSEGDVIFGLYLIFWGSGLHV